jgi:hypothetical protein
VELSLLEKPNVTQDQNMYVTKNSVTNIELSGKSGINIDRAAESMWMKEFSVTYMFWACVTLGFSNSVAFLLNFFHK